MQATTNTYDILRGIDLIPLLLQRYNLKRCSSESYAITCRGVQGYMRTLAIIIP